MFFEEFDRVRIVNLKSRSDRKKEMILQLKKVGLDRHNDVDFFSALVKPFPGMFRSAGSNGCYHSHLEIIKEAAADNKSILILQDDCDFLPEVKEYQMPENWDIFYGGYEAVEPQDLHNSDIIGAHFMALSRNAVYEASNYLSKLLDPEFPPDTQASQAENFNPEMRPPIDGAFVWFRRAHPHLTTIFHKLSFQRSSRTDLGNVRFFDQMPFLRAIMTIARRKKQTSTRSRILRDYHRRSVDQRNGMGQI